MKRDYAAIHSTLWNCGALSRSRLRELGYRNADLARWEREGKLYRPYKNTEVCPEPGCGHTVFMVER